MTGSSQTSSPGSTVHQTETADCVISGSNNGGISVSGKPLSTPTPASVLSDSARAQHGGQLCHVSQRNFMRNAIVMSTMSVCLSVCLGANYCIALKRCTRCVKTSNKIVRPSRFRLVHPRSSPKCGFQFGRFKLVLEFRLNGGR